MKFVTHQGKVSPVPKSEAFEKFQKEQGTLFAPWGKDIHHPLEPTGRLGFLIGENIIDVQLASLKYSMHGNEKNIRKLPSDIITFLAMGNEAMNFAMEVHDWCMKKTLEEINNPSPTAKKLSEVKLYAPVPRPTSMRDGY